MMRIRLDIPSKMQALVYAELCVSQKQVIAEAKLRLSLKN